MKKTAAVRKMAGGAHPGFEAVAQKIAAQRGIPIEQARAILAKSSRGASAGARKANPRLKRVRGK